MKVPRGFTLTADHRPRVNDTNKLDQHYISITFVQPLITRDSRGDANWETNERSLWYYWSSCLTILHGSLPFSSYPFSDSQRSRFLDILRKSFFYELQIEYFSVLSIIYFRNNGSRIFRILYVQKRFVKVFGYLLTFYFLFLMKFSDIYTYIFN